MQNLISLIAITTCGLLALGCDSGTRSPSTTTAAVRSGSTAATVTPSGGFVIASGGGGATGGGATFTGTGAGGGPVPGGVVATFATGGTFPDDHGDSAAASTGFFVGAPMSGALTYPTDQDWFRVTLLAGVTYEMSTFTAGDTALLLVADDGRSILASNDDAALGQRHSLITYTPGQSGTHYLVVQGGAAAAVTILPYSVKILRR